MKVWMKSGELKIKDWLLENFNNFMVYRMEIEVS